jgi:hypothetical protein
MSRGLFRLVGVRSGCWVVRDAVMHGKTTIKIPRDWWAFCTVRFNSVNSTFFPHSAFMFIMALKISSYYFPDRRELALISAVKCCRCKNKFNLSV